MTKERPEDKIGECDSCRYENVKVSAYMRSYGDPQYNKNNEYVESEDQYGSYRSYHWYCHFCASTFLSSHCSYPILYGDQHNLYSSIGWIANWFADKLKLREEET